MAIEIYCDSFELDGAQFGIELTADQHGLTACRLEPDNPSCSLKTATNPHLRAAAEQLSQYFDGTLNEFNVRLAPDGTHFQQLVWQSAAQVPFGQVRPYSWLAREVGNPKAVRAVAQALGANPLLLFVPCHRIVRSNGDLGGFSCGTKWKVLLHAHEGIKLNPQQELSLSQP